MIRFRRPTPVIRDLLIINALMFVGSFVLLGEPTFSETGFGDLGRRVLASFLPGSEEFRPYQIFTHMFMHSDLSHIFFNMLLLYFLGVELEDELGPKRFLTLYFMSGLGAWMLSTGIEYMQLVGTPAYNFSHMWGASGAVFGVLGAYGMLFAERTIQLIIPPIPVKAKYLVLVLGLLELNSGSSGAQTNIAHYAHVGGAVIGMLTIFYWYGRR